MKLVLYSDGGSILRTFRDVGKALDSAKLCLDLIRDLFEGLDYFISDERE